MHSFLSLGHLHIPIYGLFAAAGLMCAMALGLRTAPLVIITFDIQRDGSVKNIRIAERAGNSTLDYSAQRAVMDAAPFPPLPQGFERNVANVELRFHLQR